MTADQTVFDTVSGLAGLLQFELAILSRQGGRNYNEDACGHWHSDHHLCCVVADGAGGHGGGDIASKLAVEHLIGSYAALPVQGAGEVREMLVEANHSIHHHRVPGTPSQNMHSTVVALFIEMDTQTALWGHVGDSRLYAFRGGRLAERTRDHSLVQSLVDGGLLTEEQSRSHPQRSELLCALGSPDDQLMVSVSELPWSIEPGDVFLLCTDGLWEYVDEATMEHALAQAPDAQSWLAMLEAEVLRNAAHKPRHDNFSAITVWANPVI